MMRVLHVVGARPNFMKIAPVWAALAKRAHVEQVLVHTGQHYDANMSDVFFQQLRLPRPDVNLEVGSGSHAVQTAQVMQRFEEVVLARRPDLVLVYGDVNSTVAAALVCSKLAIAIGHVEAGLRSGDRSMPEEINRLVTDQLADLLFTPSTDGNDNLAREGIPTGKVHFVGNVMIDTLIRMLPAGRESLAQGPLAKWRGEKFILVTLHRPSNVDDPIHLPAIVESLDRLAKEAPVLFPVHPRTRSRLAGHGVPGPENGLHLLEPLGYLDFLALQEQAALVVTDSGGIQEETTYLGVPCLTLRDNTERPVTVTLGTNLLIGHDLALLEAEAGRALDGEWKRHNIPPLWDGCAGERIASILS